MAGLKYVCTTVENNVYYVLEYTKDHLKMQTTASDKSQS
jgi:hypothetical protein